MRDGMLPCPACEGSGLFDQPHCRGGSDHAGHNCGGRVCGTVQEPCENCDGTGRVECDHDEDHLINPRPAVKLDGRVIRWAYDCPRCKGVVTIDTESGQHAGQDRSEAFHGPSIPPSAA